MKIIINKMVKHINTKILYKHIKTKYKLYPQLEYWRKAYDILMAGYFRKIEEIEGYKALGIKKNIQYPRKPTWVPKAFMNDKNKIFVLQGHIAYAKNLDDQEILDKFGWYLINLDLSKWVRSIYKPDGTKIKKKKKKKAKDHLNELLNKPYLKKARKELNRQRILRRFKNK